MAEARPTLATLDQLGVFDDDVSERRRLARLVVALCAEIGEMRAERDEWRARAEHAEVKLVGARP
jgi:hypothetical protein